MLNNVVGTLVCTSSVCSPRLLGRSTGGDDGDGSTVRIGYRRESTDENRGVLDSQVGVKARRTESREVPSPPVYRFKCKTSLLL